MRLNTFATFAALATLAAATAISREERELSANPAELVKRGVACGNGVTVYCDGSGSVSCSGSDCTACCNGCCETAQAPSSSNCPGSVVVEPKCDEEGGGKKKGKKKNRKNKNKKGNGKNAVRDLADAFGLPLRV